MHQIIDFLKKAVTRDPLGGCNACYIVRDGSIYAYNKLHGIHAGIAMESKAEFNVPADALDAALARMPNIDSLTVNEKAVVVKCGRLSSTIKRNHDEPQLIPEMPDKWIKCPPTLTIALGYAVPFLGDRGWTQGVRLMDGRITAACNNRGIDIALPGLKCDPILLTKEVVEFLIAQGNPDGLFATDQSIMFHWADGRWMNAQLLNDKMPANIDQIFDAGGTSAPMLLDAGWRQAYSDIVGLSGEGKFSMTSQGFRTTRGDLSHSEVEYKMPDLPKTHESHWDSAVLDPMLACAEAWNPNQYPSGALFVGNNLRGMVMGYRS